MLENLPPPWRDYSKLPGVSLNMFLPWSRLPFDSKVDVLEGIIELNTRPQQNLESIENQSRRYAIYQDFFYQ